MNEQTKKQIDVAIMKVYSVLTLLWFITLYLISYFIKADINFYNWGFWFRLIFIILFCIGEIFLTYVVNEMKQDEYKKHANAPRT